MWRRGGIRSKSERYFIYKCNNVVDYVFDKVKTLYERHCVVKEEEEEPPRGDFLCSERNIL